MALPPAAAAAPMPAADAAMPAGDMPMDNAAEETAEPEVVATILKGPDGGYILVAGDEPEPGMEGEEGAEVAPEGKSFETPQALMKGIMELLNPASGAEASFGKAFRGEADDTAKKPAPEPMAQPMPLKRSASNSARNANIKTEIAAGRPVKQAVAIGYNVQRQAAKGKGLVNTPRGR